MTGEAAVHTVELYDQALRLAESLGYIVRQENLGGVAGGACEVGGQKCLFVDLTLSPVDQLDQIVEAIRHDPSVFVAATVPPELQAWMGIKKAA
jgi:hypothetical protein